MQTLEDPNPQFATQLESYFAQSLHSTFARFSPARSPWFSPPHFYLHPRCLLREENDPRLYVSPVLLCLLSDRERTLAGWQLAPPLSPRDQQSFAVLCLAATTAASVDTLTGYFGPKFRHPSVKPNKRYLKGQQKKSQRETQIASGQLILCLFVDLGVVFIYLDLHITLICPLRWLRWLWPWKWTLIDNTPTYMESLKFVGHLLLLCREAK